MTAMPHVSPTQVPAESADWFDTLQCDQETRIARMQDRYGQLGGVHPDARGERVRTLLLGELQAEDAEYHELTEARLRAWIRRAREDRAGISAVVRTFDAVFAALPGALEFRRAMAVQTVVARAMGDADRQYLIDLVPGIARFLPPTTAWLAPRPAAAVERQR